jgi:hypothetical protein
MNLSEFTLNLMLSTFLITIALSFLSILGFHAAYLEQKIILEDTALKALLTLEESIHASSLTYCAPMNRINNYTEELDSKSSYQWQDKVLTTYQKTPAFYLTTPLSATDNTQHIDGDMGGSWLLLDDCKHALLIPIATTSYANKQTTITLTQPLGTALEPPIMSGIITMTQFGFNNRGLYRKRDQGNHVLIYPHIRAVEINKNTLHLQAQDKNHEIQLQTSF